MTERESIANALAILGDALSRENWTEEAEAVWAASDCVRHGASKAEPKPDPIEVGTLWVRRSHGGFDDTHVEVEEVVPGKVIYRGLPAPNHTPVHDELDDRGFRICFERLPFRREEKPDGC